jgi:hypothetical protein
MGISIFTDEDNSQFVLACNTTDYAFGPVFFVPGSEDPIELARDFLNFLAKDARLYDDKELFKNYQAFLKENDLLEE